MKRWTFNRVYQRLTTRKILLPRLTKEEVEILLQIEQVRRDFGEEGVKRYLDELEKQCTD